MNTSLHTPVMGEDFDAAREPMRAIRDLIVACESVFGADCGEDEILTRAQAGFSALRAEFGDMRPSDQIGEVAAMHEPRGMREALQLAAGALRTMEHMSLVDPQQPIRFTGAWSHLGTLSISSILDRTNDALEPAKEETT
jgi:hypothetical protein